MYRFNLGNSNAYLAFAKPLITVCRFAALAPIHIAYYNNKYHIELAETTSSYVKVFILYVPSFYVAISIYRKFRTELYLMYYLTRNILAILVHITCQKKRQEIMNGFKHVSNLGVALPKLWYIKPVIMIAVIFAVVWMSEHVFLDSPLDRNLNLLQNLVPAVELVLLCSQFACQILAFRVAIAQANQQIRDFSNQAITSKFPSLRPIMLRHHKLRKVCSILNQAYGLQMLFATSIVFVEVTFTIFNLILISQDEIHWYSIIWTFLYTIPVGAVMRLSQDVENLSYETRTVACKLKALRSSPFSTPERRNEVREWEIQLRHQKASFTAYNLFDLNRSQMQTVVATIISYVIILLQNWQPPSN